MTSIMVGAESGTQSSANTVLANKLLQRLVDEFKTGRITKTISSVPFIKDPSDDRPCWNWTLKNRTLMVMQGTFDARNMSQWNAVNRRIAPDSEAIYIIKPRTAYACVKCSKKKKHTVWMLYKKRKFVCEVCALSFKFSEMTDAPEAKISRRILGYGCQPEFRVEDTVGESLPRYRPVNPPPLSDVARSWNIDVQYQTDPTGRTMGSYRPETRDMSLGTEDHGIFFHEISHAADNMILEKSGQHLKGGQDPIQEAVAQLSACALAEIYHTTPIKFFTFDYLRQYTRRGDDVGIVRLALRVLDRTSAVIELILSSAHDLQTNASLADNA